MWSDGSNSSDWEWVWGGNYVENDTSENCVTLSGESVPATVKFRDHDCNGVEIVQFVCNRGDINDDQLNLTNLSTIAKYREVDTSENEHYIAVSYPDGINWPEALLYCQTQFNTSLASIHTKTENDEVHSLLSNMDTLIDDNRYNYAWIGYNDIDNESVWEWADGTDT